MTERMISIMAWGCTILVLLISIGSLVPKAAAQSDKYPKMAQESSVPFKTCLREYGRRRRSRLGTFQRWEDTDNPAAGALGDTDQKLIYERLRRWARL